MSGIFGIFNRDGSPANSGLAEVMRREMACWGGKGGGVFCNGPIAMGVAQSFNTPNARSERLPSWDSESGLAFSAAARVDNRTELAGCLGITAELAHLADGELIRRAYLRWGDSCAEKIYGDWSFAAWDARTRRLLLARDHCGNTALYYHSSPRVFAFASSRRALLAVNLAPVELDELYLGQILINWPAYHGERTIHKPVKRLPPAHTLAITGEREELRRYWLLENTPELRLSGRNDYVEGLKEVFERAVGDCLRSEGEIGVTLSGGLDSSSVTVTAAGILKERQQRLKAFTSTPLYSTDAFVGARFGDESDYARATANEAGNVDLETVQAAEMTPLGAIRQALEISLEPMHSAGNMFWILEMNRVAAARGCRTLLTGQHGNGGISWKGSFSSQSLVVQLQRMGWGPWVRMSLGLRAPLAARRAMRRYRSKEDWTNTAIHAGFAHRLNVMAGKLHDPEQYPSGEPLAERCRVVRPGQSFVGAIHAEHSAAAGLEIRDPTADARVLAYCFSVPDRFYFDAATGLDRWLIREAMKGRLPDSVRLNQRRGRQAGDIVQRLRASAGEVDTALTEIAAGPGAEYVNIGLLRKAWDTIQASDSPQSFQLATRVLTRGIMAGIFVNGFSENKFR